MANIDEIQAAIAELEKDPKMGECDICESPFYINDTPLGCKEYKDTIFNLQYCGEACLAQAKANYPRIAPLSFEPITITHSNKNEITPKIIQFISASPWAVSYNANQMVSHIEELQHKDPETLTENEKIFLENWELIK